MNVTTIYVIWARRSVRSKSIAPLLCSLAVSDLLRSSIGISIQAARFGKMQWPLPEDQCKYFAYYFYLNWMASAMILSFVGINRALAIYSYNTGVYSYSGEMYFQ